MPRSGRCETRGAADESESKMSAAENELVDIVDDAGVTVRVATRKEMRIGRLPHRCTYIFVFNHKGEIFVHQRTSTKDVFPSHWDMAVGGVLSAGEDFDSGARRELAEELGIDAVPTPLFSFRYIDERTDVFARAYDATHDGPFALQADEIITGEFLNVADLESRMKTHLFCPDAVEVWKARQGQMADLKVIA